MAGVGAGHWRKRRQNGLRRRRRHPKGKSLSAHGCAIRRRWRTSLAHDNTALPQAGATCGVAAPPRGAPAERQATLAIGAPRTGQRMTRTYDRMASLSRERQADELLAAAAARLGTDEVIARHGSTSPICSQKRLINSGCCCSTRLGRRERVTDCSPIRVARLIAHHKHEA